MILGKIQFTIDKAIKIQLQILCYNFAKKAMINIISFKQIITKFFILCRTY